MGVGGGGVGGGGGGGKEANYMRGGAFHYSIAHVHMCEFLKRGGPPPFRCSLFFCPSFCWSVGVAAVVTRWWTRLLKELGRTWAWKYGALR